MEGLLILLRRLCYPNHLSGLCGEFGRLKSSLLKISDGMLLWVWNRWGNLLTQPFQQPFFTADRVEEYVEAISRVTNVNLFIWGFIDGTVRPICRPKRNQRLFFNGHKRIHAVKFEVVAAPRRMIVHTYGPVEGCRHDAVVLGESGLLQDMEAHMNGPNGMPYAVYGDSAYPLSAYLQKPFRGAALGQDQQRFNREMSASRIAVEWSFGDISTHWAFVDMKKQQKILLQPVGIYYQVAAFFTNLHTIIRFGNKTSKHFGINPPCLLEYLQ